MCDLAVASDDYNLDRVHDNKVLKYGIQDIHAWMLRSAPVDTQRLLPNVGAFMSNWRGLMSQKSFKSFRFWKDCGVPRSGLTKIVTSVLNQSYKIWRTRRFHRRRTTSLVVMANSR